MSAFFFSGALTLKWVLSGLKHDDENSQHLRKEKHLKKFLETLECWCCSILVSAVTQVLLNHVSYLCYLDLSF